MDTISITILGQIYAIDEFAMVRYKAYDFNGLEECEEYEGGLTFSTNGDYFIGKVIIQLTWLDEYTVLFVDKYGHSIKDFHHVYFPELVEVLNFIDVG